MFADRQSAVETRGRVLICRSPAPLHGASFTSVKQLREHIDAFIKAYNTTAAPFAWTKSEVHQKRLKPRFADQ
jgi:hypothetical protein